MTYTTAVKNTHRAAVCELAHADKRKRPVLYVDHDDAAATRFFRARGLPASRLVPVNNKREHCERIFAATRVRAVHGDMEAVVLAQDKSFSVVWLDGQSRSVSVECLRASLKLAPYVSITLATRGARADDLVDALLDAVSQCGGCVLEAPTRYAGKSGVSNVLRVLVGRRGATVPATAKLVGTTVCIPAAEWPADEPWFRTVKRKGDALCFRVVATHHRKRLRVHAIDKDDHLHPRPEQWTLTPEQVMAFCG